RASETKRKNIGVSVATVRSEDLSDVASETVDLALQGKVAGANIQRNHGAPGGGAQVRPRGVSSNNGQAEPLLLLDGMLASNVAVPSGISVVTKSRAGSNPSPNQDSLVNRIADLNAEEIESIEVLKGAAAAAIYGSKASNGVIIINTKKGQPGPPRVEFTQRVGVSSLSKELSDVWRVNVNSYLIHSVASRGITNNDNSNTSFYIVLPFIPNFYDLRRRPDGTYPPDPFISNGNNPLQTAALMKNDEGVWRILSSVDSTLKLWRTDEQQLNLIFNGGVDRFQQEDDLLFPPSLYWAPADGLPGT